MEKITNARNRITFLGTGNALATRCYNTCFTIHSSGGTVLLVDAGGGNGIFNQLLRAGIERESITDIFVTHAHTDHILGVVWLIRLALQKKTPMIIHSHRKVIELLKYICYQTMPDNTVAGIGSMVVLHELTDGEAFQVGDISLRCFDIHSSKETQYGFTAVFEDGLRLVCLGDEPYNEINECYVRDADWLMCEAFCLYEDRDSFHPYEKHHSTALDAARLAEGLDVRNLILYHTEDKTLPSRRMRYTAEAQGVFSGRVVVPDDLEAVVLD